MGHHEAGSNTEINLGTLASMRGHEAGGQGVHSGADPLRFLRVLPRIAPVPCRSSGEYVEHLLLKLRAIMELLERKRKFDHASTWRTAQSTLRWRSRSEFTRA